MGMKVIRKDGGVSDLESLSQHTPTSEETPNYKRISGTDIAGNPKEAIQQIVEQFRKFDITPHMLKEFDTFEQTMLAVLIMKFHLMIAKQKDYGPGNILKAGQRGIATRAQDKLERLLNLIGDPETKINTVDSLLNDLPDDASYRELDEFASAVSTVLRGNKAANESIDDTWMDLGNYGDIGYTEFHGAFGKPLEENQ
jgi:hypothetical protein